MLEHINRNVSLLVSVYCLVWAYRHCYRVLLAHQRLDLSVGAAPTLTHDIIKFAYVNILIRMILLEQPKPFHLLLLVLLVKPLACFLSWWLWPYSFLIGEWFSERLLPRLLNRGCVLIRGGVNLNVCSIQVHSQIQRKSYKWLANWVCLLVLAVWGCCSVTLVE